MFLAISDIKYLHQRSAYKKGNTEIEQGLDFIFDCYVSKDTNVILRVIEGLMIALLVGQYTAPYPYGLAPAIVSVILYFIYICLNINLYATFNIGTRERTLQRRIIWLSIAFQFVMMTMNINYCLLGGLNLMSLMSAKALSVIWLIQLFFA